MNDDKINKSVLPYRPGVGLMIINRNKEIFVGRRANTKIQAWQMPQGGIVLGETPSFAALREMKEEIGTDKGTIIAESKYWYKYDVPTAMIPKLWNGNFRGQKQKWFLIQFTGTDLDINVHTMDAEFEAWKWAKFDELLHIVIPFKARLYTAVIGEFRKKLEESNFIK